MRYLINVVYLALLVAVSPWLAYSAVRYGKYRAGWTEKLCGLVPTLSDHPTRIWFHAVSVGEVNLLAPILERLATTQPLADIVISATTKTGYGLAKRKYPGHTVFYCPLDFSWAVRNAMQRIKPQLLVLVELELWPNLLACANRLDVPVAIMNGRLSDNSTRGYQRLGPLIRNWLSHLALVAAQSELCARRFVQLGVPAHRVHAVGSLKFDGAATDRDQARTRDFKALAGIADDDVVFLAGSTQSPEEAMALRVYQRLSPEFPRLRLILVPRHPERTTEVSELLNQCGEAWMRRSRCDSMEAASESASARVLLVDTVGELGAWWGCAHLGFVGGSMGKRGGQNMLEPAGLAVATCFGPNTRNFRDVVELLLAENAARVVQDETALYDFVRKCLLDENYGRQLGRRAQNLVLAQRGASDTTVRLLNDLLATGHVAFQRHDEPLSHVRPTSGDPQEARNQARRRA